MIDFYNSNIRFYIDVLQDFVFIIGVFPFLWFIKNYSFNKKKEKIANNLNIRKEIQEKLLEYVKEYYENKRSAIGVRVVYWRNYPWKLSNDGYKHILYYNVNTPIECKEGTNFISNTGILLEDDYLVRSGKTIFKGKYEIYICDDKGKKIKGFKEIEQDVKIVRTLKFKHIINWDFEERIEYEPILYTRYRYNSERLYENERFVTNFYGERMPESGTKNNSLWIKLNRKNQVTSNKCLKYFYLLLKSKVKKDKDSTIKYH